MIEQPASRPPYGPKVGSQAADGDFLARLAAAQSSLSPKMARLAAYLSENYLEAAFMTTREIAAATGVSLATVVRFPAVLGYCDFDALRASIRDRVNVDLSAVERLRAMSAGGRTRAGEQHAPAPTASTLLHRIIDAEAENLTALARTFSEAEVERFVRPLLDSRDVMIVGFRYVSPLALYFGYSLAKIKPGVQAFTQADSSLYDRIRLMDSGDVLVAIALARYPSDLLSLVRYAHGLGRCILAITDSPVSPILPLADVALFARSSVLDFAGTLGAPAALINCVVSELGVRMGDSAVARLQALEDVARQAGTYVRSLQSSVSSRQSEVVGGRSTANQRLTTED
jgi:DNA-binding MurR/RpiR family transcriptional regulator